MNYTQSLGNITELQCISKFIELGYEVSIPYGNGAKYDFIVDIDGKLLRIQCKSSRQVRRSDGTEDLGAFCFTCTSSTTNTQKTIKHTYSENQIDYFSTVWQNKVYLVPVNECSTSKTLRILPPQKENQLYNKAEDYEIEKIVNYSEDLLNSKEEFEKRWEEQKIQKEELHCKSCGQIISKKAVHNLCPSCLNISKRKCERPNRKELKQLIRTLPFTEIAKKFGVSDNSIRKWCKFENLPQKKSEIQKYTEEEWENI
jgi:predicted RNA-binding Zn-ribbon protein involved in translation (DUF1610 family)